MRIQPTYWALLVTWGETSLKPLGYKMVELAAKAERACLGPGRQEQWIRGGAQSKGECQLCRLLSRSYP